MSLLDKHAESLVDQAYLNNLPPELRPICQRHGCELFSFVMLAGQCEHATQYLAHRIAKNRELIEVLGILSSGTEKFCNQVAVAKGYTKQQVDEVKQDIEIAATLAESTHKQIILPN